MKWQKPKLSVVVAFYNMRREAERTLYSLTADYQMGIARHEYEVIAIDNGSSEPLGEEYVTAIDGRFRYVYLDTASKSPASALNHGVDRARGELVTCLIDGARILSPKLLDLSRRACDTFTAPFAYTLGMHLGPDLQNKSVLNGYDQESEDELLESVDWRSNGYELFRVSSLAGSSGTGYFSESSESNAITLRKLDYLRLGGYDVRFQAPGGGLVNLDFFNRLQQDQTLKPVMILGEATFHQFHGGAATSKPIAEHPWNDYAAEYEYIKGKPYRTVWNRPYYIGHVPLEGDASLYWH